MGIRIIEAKRSPIGKFGGSLCNQDVAYVCSTVIKKLLRSSKISKKDIKLSIFGNVYSSGHGQAISKKICTESGLSNKTVAYTINMVCGSGMQAINNACLNISNNNELVVLAGGYEFMSNVPFGTYSNSRFSKKFGNYQVIDLLLKDGLIDSTLQIHMGKTAEHLAKQFKITRDEQDKYAFMTKKRFLNSQTKGLFKNEIVPILVTDIHKKNHIFKKDEFITSLSSKKLKHLKPCFDKSGSGTVTPGNSSGINDGCAFVLLASDKYCKQHNINSNIEILDCVSIGCDNMHMGLGPYYSIKKLLRKNKLCFSDVDVLEINEAFSAQILSCIKLLSVEYKVPSCKIIKKTNPLGSGLGLGHPLGCSGARIIVTLYHYMKTHKCKYAIASLCIGGGMGIAMLLKKHE